MENDITVIFCQNDPSLMWNTKQTKSQFGHCTTSASCTCAGSHISKSNKMGKIPTCNYYSLNN